MEPACGADGVAIPGASRAEDARPNGVVKVSGRGRSVARRSYVGFTQGSVAGAVDVTR